MARPSPLTCPLTTRPLLLACLLTAVVGVHNVGERRPTGVPSIRSLVRHIERRAVNVARRVASAAAGAARNSSADPDGKNSWENYTHHLNRAKPEECKKWLYDEEVDMCMIAGGINPAVEKHKEQYTTKDWHEIFNGIPYQKCDFCGAAGIYEGNSEGTVMVTCQKEEGHVTLTERYTSEKPHLHDRIASKNSFSIEEFCLSKGKFLEQDTVLMRFDSKVWWARTYNAQKREGKTYEEAALVKCTKKDLEGEDFRARFLPVPVAAKGLSFGSEVAKLERIIFEFDKDNGGPPPDCFA